MSLGRSDPLTGPLGSRADAEMALPALRWLMLGAAALALCILALSRAGAVGAAAPADCIPINYTTCVSNGTFYTNGNPVSSIAPTYVAPSYSYVAPSYVAPGAPAYVAPNTTSTGYPANTVVSTYFDPRYCDGNVSVVTDSSGNLIDVCTDTGQRIYPVYPDYGGYGGYVSPSYSGIYNNAYYNNGYYNNYYNGGCPSGNFSCTGYVNGNYVGGCASGNFSCLGYYPYYTGVYNGNYTVVAPSNNLITVGAPYRVNEVAQPAAAPTAPGAQMATALNAPLQQPAPDASAGGAGVKVLSVDTATTPAANNDGREDGK